jgi:regulator of protease activity HflC (stomatin/prohibitin superfamily)
MRMPFIKKSFPYVGFRATGVHWYWPVCSSVNTIPIKQQTAKLPPQYLMTKDGKTITVSGVVVFDVVDAVTLLAENFDPDQTVRDYSMSEIKSVVERVTLEDLCKINNNLDKELTKILRCRLKVFGIRVIRYRLTDFAACRLYGLMTRDNTVSRSFVSG